MKEVFLEPLDKCPACNATLDKSGVCSNCGSTVYDFCGEHVRNHNGKTYLRFICKGQEVMVQISSHYVSLVSDSRASSDSKFAVTFDVLDTLAMGCAPEKNVEEEISRGKT